MQARIVPAFKDGAGAGLQALLASARTPSTRRSASQNGDVIKRINGFDLNSPEKALEVYSKLKEATRIDIEIERNGSTDPQDVQRPLTHDRMHQPCHRRSPSSPCALRRAAALGPAARAVRRPAPPRPAPRPRPPAGDAARRATASRRPATAPRRRCRRPARRQPRRTTPTCEEVRRKARYNIYFDKVDIEKLVQTVVRRHLQDLHPPGERAREDLHHRPGERARWRSTRTSSTPRSSPRSTRTASPSTRTARFLKIVDKQRGEADPHPDDRRTRTSRTPPTSR